jgi:hypothetical protein
MAKIPDRKMWDKRTKSYMYYPGIKPVEVHVGSAAATLTSLTAPIRSAG